MIVNAKIVVSVSFSGNREYCEYRKYCENRELFLSMNDPPGICVILNTRVNFNFLRFDLNCQSESINCSLPPKYMPKVF